VHNVNALEGKATLITGAAAGIGRGIALRFAREGAAVAVCDRQPKVADVAAEMEVAGATVYSEVLDVRDADGVRRFVDAAAHRFGGLDIVVANAGVWRLVNPLTDSWEKGLAEFELLVNTNLRGVFATGRAAMPHLVARAAATGRGCHIINVATDHITPPPGFATGGGRWMDIYDASKWGVNGLTQSWSKVLAEHNVRVNALCMDAVDSEMSRGAAGSKLTPERMANWMTPDQMAQLALDLIAEGDSGRTGENIPAWRDHPVSLPPRSEVLPSRHA
jgi:NAD(P)-dependent dehydrogenase (short-subunit alcohol dehydrogenase family)